MESIIRELGFSTLVDLKNNFIDKGDFLSLIKPIKGILAIQKGPFKHLDWESAQVYTNTLCLGGFNDWHIPYKEQLMAIAKFKFIFAKEQMSGAFWSKTEYWEEEFCNLADEYDSVYRFIVDVNSAISEKILVREDSFVLGEEDRKHEVKFYNVSRECNICGVRSTPEYCEEHIIVWG